MSYLNCLFPSWTDETCLFLWYFRESQLTNVTFEWLLYFMNKCNMLFQITFNCNVICSYKCHIWRVFSFMNSCNVFISQFFLQTQLGLGFCIQWIQWSITSSISACRQATKGWSEDRRVLGLISDLCCIVWSTY